MRERSTAGPKSIYRIDRNDKHEHGWSVQVVLCKRKYTKWFSDSRYGDNALPSAIAWRDNKEQILHKERSEVIIHTMAKSNTGVVGIVFNEIKRCYKVTFIHNGEPFSTTISIDKYGKDLSFKIAKLIRKEKNEKRIK